MPGSWNAAQMPAELRKSRRLTNIHFGFQLPICMQKRFAMRSYSTVRSPKTDQAHLFIPQCFMRLADKEPDQRESVVRDSNASNRIGSVPVSRPVRPVPARLQHKAARRPGFKHAQRFSIQQQDRAAPSISLDPAFACAAPAIEGLAAHRLSASAAALSFSRWGQQQIAARCRSSACSAAGHPSLVVPRSSPRKTFPPPQSAGSVCWPKIFDKGPAGLSIRLEEWHLMGVGSPVYASRLFHQLHGRAIANWPTLPAFCLSRLSRPSSQAAVVVWPSSTGASVKCFS